MKYFLIFGTAFLLLCQSCKKESFYGEDEYKASYNTWLRFKKESNNSYVYTTTWSSWTGFYGRMIITVKGGKIIARDYKVTGADENDRSVTKIYEEWQEDEATVNSHPGASQTLDEVYTTAKNEWLKVNEKENLIYFEAKNDGMISSCGYVPIGCADDCFIGITITEIKKNL